MTSIRIKQDNNCTFACLRLVARTTITSITKVADFFWDTR